MNHHIVTWHVQADRAPWSETPPVCFPLWDYLQINLKPPCYIIQTQGGYSWQVWVFARACVCACVRTVLYCTYACEWGLGSFWSHDGRCLCANSCCWRSVNLGLQREREQERKLCKGEPLTKLVKDGRNEGSVGSLEREEENRDKRK